MSDTTTRFRFFILGLLAERPMSGYDIKRLLESLAKLVGNPSFGKIYPALHGLVDEGLATVEITAQTEQRIRKIYTITPAGRQALESWIAQSEDPAASDKSFVMQLILTSNLAQDRVVDLVRRRREMVVAHHSALNQAILGWDEQSNQGQRLAIEYGLAMACAELSWLDQLLAQWSTNRDDLSVDALA